MSAHLDGAKALTRQQLIAVIERHNPGGRIPWLHRRPKGELIMLVETGLQSAQWSMRVNHSIDVILASSTKGCP